MLAVRLVDHDHGEAKLTLFGHAAQTVYACGGLLAAAEDPVYQLGIAIVDQRDQIPAVVNDDVRTCFDYS